MPWSLSKDCIIWVMARSLNIQEIPERLTVEEFWDLFGQTEHEALDFKRGVPGDVLSTIPAMAMTSGGLIVHGVTRDLEIVGCRRSQRTLDRITRYAKECYVEVETRAVLVEETELTITSVPEIRGRIVTTPDGRLLRRVGGDSQPLRGDAHARFVRQRTELSGEEEPAPGLKPSDLDLSSLNQALDADGRPRVRRDNTIRALVDLHVARVEASPSETEVLRAAVVLFAQNPEQFVPRAVVQLVRREGVSPGPGPAVERTEYSGPLGKTLERCLQFITKHTKQFEVITGTTRDILPEYPTPVLREAVINALAHRDYNLVGATVDVTIWDDRIEIQSPGPLPGHITIENMRHEHFSRNPRIMRVLKTMRLVEEYGEGVDRMYREMEARLMEPPIFTSSESSVKVTLRNRFLVNVEDQVWLALLGSYQLTADERRVLVATRWEGAVTPRLVRQMIPDVQASHLLSGCVAKGLLVRVGERGGSQYVLSDEVLLRVGTTAMEAQNRKRQMLLDEINRVGSISTVEGAKLLDENMAMVRSILNDLVRAGLARAEGRTRARRYYRV